MSTSCAAPASCNNFSSQCIPNQILLASLARENFAAVFAGLERWTLQDRQGQVAQDPRVPSRKDEKKGKFPTKKKTRLGQQLPYTQTEISSKCALNTQGPLQASKSKLEGKLEVSDTSCARDLFCKPLCNVSDEVQQKRNCL